MSVASPAMSPAVSSPASALMMECSPAKLDQVTPQTLTDEDAESVALALRLQEEERAYARLWMVSPPQDRQEQSPEDEESLALAIRLQQEEDEAQLRATLGLDDGEDVPGSPSNYSYEQLLRLGESVGTVSKGASSEAIGALQRMSVIEARNEASVLLGDQCSICRMEYEDEDELQLLPCKHCEHAECLTQWLKMSKCCPLCQAELLPA